MKNVIVVLALLIIALGLYANGVVAVNSISQTLSAVYDMANGGVEANVATLGEMANTAPNKVAISGEYAYVVITYENAIQKIDLFSGTQRSMIYLEAGALPNDITIDEETHFAYVSGNGTNKVYKINLDTDEVVANVSVGQAPQGMEIADGKLYVANTGFNASDYTYNPGTISIIDLSTFTNEGEINTDLNPTTIKKIGSNLHVVCTGNYVDIGGKVDIIDYGMGELVQTLNLQAAVSSIAYDETRGNVFVGLGWGNGVFVYSAQEFEIIHNADEDIFQGGAALCVADNYLAVADPGTWTDNSHIRFYNLSDFTLVSDVEVGVGVTDVKYFLGNLNTDESDLTEFSNVSFCYPNPFFANSKGDIKINYFAKSTQNISYNIFNIKGQKIYTKSINLKTGENEIAWNGKNNYGKSVTSGVYYFKINTKEGKVIRKVTILK